MRLQFGGWPSPALPGVRAHLLRPISMRARPFSAVFAIWYTTMPLPKDRPSTATRERGMKQVIATLVSIMGDRARVWNRRTPSTAPFNQRQLKTIARTSPGGVPRAQLNVLPKLN